MCTDGWRAYGILSLEEGIEIESQATSPSKVDGWLPKVHTAIANLKRFLPSTFHGVSSPKLQKYLGEFVYRYNRRFWEPQLPHRLLTVCANHLPSTPRSCMASLCRHRFRSVFLYCAIVVG
ncbi:MAG: transposase [Gammaproteobacteria bacterium]|nr:transposase [Gammaproteobacteria bacterium]MYD81395.1 transposase [Gammaproteobacteria bacterium]